MHFSSFFMDAIYQWKLIELYKDIAQISQQSLTDLEKACLRGLLMGLTPYEVTVTLKLTDEPQDIVIQICLNIRKLIQILTNKTAQKTFSKQDIPQWLEEAGYHKSIHEENWGNAPEIKTFYGREKELTQLVNWSQKEHRLLAIFGISGIGKTSLAVKFAEKVQTNFDYFFWKGLETNLAFDDLLTDILAFITHQPKESFPDDKNKNLSQLIDYLQNYRILIILDNWQALLRSKDLAGLYQEECQDYRNFLQKVAEVSHQSCLVISSSEKPLDFDSFDRNKVKTMSLTGLGEDSYHIFQEYYLKDEYAWDELIERYRGNPSDLKQIAPIIQQVYSGQVNAFLNQQTKLGVMVYQNSEQKILSLIARLSSLEKQIIITLATLKNPLTTEQLFKQLKTQFCITQMTEAITSLLRRNLMETIADTEINQFTLQPTVMKVASRHLVKSLPATLNSQIIQPQTPLKTEPVKPKKINIAPPPMHNIDRDEDDDDDDEDSHDLQPISLTTIIGGFFIVAAFGVVITLVSTLKYPVAVRGEALIRPQGELRLIQSATEGTVKQILVKENQTLKKGDTIILIDDASLQTKKSQSENKIEQYKSELKQLDYQLDKQTQLIQAEKERINRTVASLKANLNLIIREYEQRKTTATMQVKEAQTQVTTRQQELIKAKAALQSAQAELESAKIAFEGAISKRDRYQKISEEGVISRERYLEAALSAQRQEKEYEVKLTQVKRQKIGIAQRKQEIEAAKARLNRLEAALNPSQASIEAQKQKIAEENARGKATLATLQKEQDSLIQQQIRLKQQLNRDLKEIQQIERYLQQTIIRSPSDGVLFDLSLRNPHQNVHIGQEIAKIAPSNASLVIKAQVAPSDISKVQVKQEVQMRVSACPYPDYGTLKGKVSKISPDAIASPTPKTTKKNSPSQGVYEVTIIPDNLLLQQAGKSCQAQLGMEGKVDIIAREETVLHFLLRKARLATDI